MVGTEGFMPPEGPGMPSADIFGLGKLFYETFTGMDRLEFPKLASAGRGVLLDPNFAEINALIMRACSSDLKERYASANELAADLALLISGKSVRQLRGLERRLRIAKRAVGGVAVMALLAAGLSWLFSQQVKREQGLRARAESAELASQRELHMQEAYTQRRVSRSFARRALALNYN